MAQFSISDLKNKILSNPVSNKFKGYAEKKIFIPTFLDTKTEIYHKDYFLSQNIDINDIVSFNLNIIQHKDCSIRFALSRGFLAIYPNQSVSNPIEDMNDRLSSLIDNEFNQNDMLYIPFLELFIIAIYIRTWMWYGRGMEYSKFIYYNKRTRQLYGCSPSMEEVLPITLEDHQYAEDYTIEYVTNAFEKTIGYDEKYLTTNVLLIPITGMHEAIILNDNVIDGYKYN